MYICVLPIGIQSLPIWQNNAFLYKTIHLKDNLSVIETATKFIPHILSVSFDSVVTDDSMENEYIFTYVLSQQHKHVMRYWYQTHVIKYFAAVSAHC